LTKAKISRLYLIPILSKAMDILELLETEKKPLTLEDIFQRVHISKTSLGDFEPEQQIMIVVLASCSSLLRNRSRWSGTPSTTLVSQVPQTPSVQA